MLREIFWGYGVESVGSGYGPVAGSCEHDVEPSGSIATAILHTRRDENLKSHEDLLICDTNRCCTQYVCS
jgi:hypothetical protein